MSDERYDLTEELGRLVDTLDNLLAAGQLPLPPDLHLRALRESLKDVKDRIKQAYFESGGEDVWSWDS